MKRVASIGVLVALALGLSVWAGSQRANAGLLPRTLKSSGLVLGGRARCTATLESEVQAGQALSVKLVLHNNSKRAVKYSSGVFAAGITLKAAGGTTYASDGDLVARACSAAVSRHDSSRSDGDSPTPRHSRAVGRHRFRSRRTASGKHSPRSTCM